MIPRLVRIRLSGVRGLPALDLPLPQRAGRPAPLVVTGPAASGKTRLLEAIIAGKEACAAYGVHPNSSAWFDDPKRGSVSLHWSCGEAGEPSVEAQWAPADPLSVQRIPSPLRAALRDYAPDVSKWKLEYFDAGRRLERGRSGDMPSTHRVSAGERISATGSKYDFVRSYLCRAALEHSARVAQSIDQDGLVLASDRVALLDELGARLSDFSDKLTWRGARQQGAETLLMFARRTSTGSRDVELAALSGAESMLVLFAATIVALGLRSGLVLVDMPELGIHPEDQARMFEGLQRTMQDGQLIVTTSAPAILRSVPAENVVVLPGL